PSHPAAPGTRPGALGFRLPPFTLLDVRHHLAAGPDTHPGVQGSRLERVLNARASVRAWTLAVARSHLAMLMPRRPAHALRARASDARASRVGMAPMASGASNRQSENRLTKLGRFSRFPLH